MNSIIVLLYSYVNRNKFDLVLIYRIHHLLVKATIVVILPALFLLSFHVKAQDCTLIPLVISPQTTAATCVTGGTALISIKSGGSPPYIYKWSPNVSTTNSASNLAPGTYTVSVTDTRCHIPPGKELVANGNFNAGNTGFSSSYNYCNLPNCLFPQTTYAIGPDPNYFHSNFFGADHTSGTGNFMIINGAVTPNVSLWCQTVPNILPNNNYVFSTWVCAANDLGRAQLQFSINGIVLGNPFFGPPTVGSWLHFCTIWNSGANTSANICIVNQNTELNGNDFGLDDISFRLCEPTITTFTIGESPAVSTTMTSTNAGCNGQGSASVAAMGGIPGYTYLWNTGQITSTINGLTPGNYSVLVTDAVGCTSSNAVTITSMGNVTASVGPNVSICAGYSQPLMLKASGGDNYLWTFTGEITSSISVKPLVTTKYAVIVSVGNCFDTAEVTVTVNPLAQTNFNATTVCFGNPTEFKDLSTIVPGTITAWDWNFNDPDSGLNTNSNMPNPAHQFTKAGTFNVTLTTTSDKGCKNSITFPVTLNTLPVAVFSSTSGCLHTMTGFNSVSTSSISDPINTWDWDYGDNSAHGNTTDPIHTYTKEGTYTATLIVATVRGCKDTIDNLVMVYGLPVANYTHPVDGCLPVVCTKFKDLSFSPIGEMITNWKWSCPGGNPSTSSEQNPFFCWNKTGRYDVELIVTTNHGCKDTLRSPGYIQVYALPTADFCVTPNTAPSTNPVFTFCNKWTNDVTKWTWDFGDNSPLDSTHVRPQHSYSSSVTNNAHYIYNICLRVETQHGCWDTTCRRVTIQPEYTFYIPNTFTPNADFTNDFFYGKGIGIKEYSIWIFDRWGNQVWDCTYRGENTDWDGPQQEGMPSFCKWDGKVEQRGSEVAQQDVYVWKVKLTDIFDKTHIYLGQVNLVK
jgi:gliding motility-associated-like protein